MMGYLLLRIIPLIFVLLKLSPAIEYQPTELLVIYWGQESNQLMRGFAIPENPADTFLTERGPNKAFVDKNENMYFSSYHHSYIKGFHKNGELFVYYSPEIDGFNKSIFRGTISDFYVDSLFRIFIVAFPGLIYIPIADTANNLLDSLVPPMADNGRISRMFSNGNDVLTFLCVADDGHTYYTYSNNHFTRGGKIGKIAPNGNYYGAYADTAGVIVFIVHDQPDQNSQVDVIEEVNIPYAQKIKRIYFLAVDDSMHQYIYIVHQNSLEDIIQIYDMNYNLLAEVKPWARKQWIDLHMIPFVRADGNIYEFRCLDDGLHVIRWSRKE